MGTQLISHSSGDEATSVMKRAFVIVASIAALLCSSEAQETNHILETLGLIDSSASTGAMTARIKEAAVVYEDEGPVPRFAQFDFAFGKDLDEYKALNGFGILYLATVCQNSASNPVDSVYFKSGRITVRLRLIGKLRIPVEDGLTRKVFGKNRIDYYYYLPYIATRRDALLEIDWSDGRRGFELAEFPSDLELDYMPDASLVPPDPKGSIDAKILDNFAEREFQIKLQR
jgi:hypothetical protein